MPISSFRRPILSVVLLALAAALLLAPQAEAQKSVPTLVSTPQYKALVAYVAKLNSLKTTPVSSARRQFYETTLETKHGDAVAKSTALFNRARKRAAIATKTRLRRASEEVRETEAADLEAIRIKFGRQLINAAATYEANVTAIRNEFELQYERLLREIRILRERKAKAKNLKRKAEIQERITQVIDQIRERKRREFDELSDLEDSYIQQRRAIAASKARNAAAVRETADDEVATLRKEQQRSFNRKVAALQTKRANQVKGLDVRLTEGRFYISQMPAA